MTTTTRESHARVLLGALAVLDLSVYPANSDRLGSAAVAWAIIDIALLWRLWRHGSAAWYLLAALNVVALALSVMTLFHLGSNDGQSHWWAVSFAAQLIILFAQPIRWWAQLTPPRTE
jgi:hypothetical protein